MRMRPISIDGAYEAGVVQGDGRGVVCDACQHDPAIEWPVAAPVLPARDAATAGLARVRAARLPPDYEPRLVLHASLPGGATSSESAGTPPL